MRITKSDLREAFMGCPKIINRNEIMSSRALRTKLCEEIMKCAEKTEDGELKIKRDKLMEIIWKK